MSAGISHTETRAGEHADGVDVMHNEPGKLAQLAVATANPGKLRELAELLATQQIEVLGLQHFALDPIAETGLTFVENALLKARHLARKLADETVIRAPIPVLADDSGLVVPALQGGPGLYSARYSGADAGDADNNRLLLDNMRHLHGEQRRAWFHCTLVCLRHATDPDPLLAVARWHGHIADRASGRHGFGYDPLFVPSGMQQSAASMVPEDKARLSHRGQALQLLLRRLPEWW
jgi:XTP/dITP diphosphohydrolase